MLYIYIFLAKNLQMFLLKNKKYEGSILLFVRMNSVDKENMNTVISNEQWTPAGPLWPILKAWVVILQVSPREALMVSCGHWHSSDGQWALQIQSIVRDTHDKNHRAQNKCSKKKWFYLLIPLDSTTWLADTAPDTSE